jgi:neutral ceramidase
MPDLVIWEDPGTRRQLRSPLDEFNAREGAALCGSGLVPPYGRMPGSTSLAGSDVCTSDSTCPSGLCLPSGRCETTPYGSCNVLNDRVAAVYETAIGIDLDRAPICDTTRTTVSALRLGEHVLVTLPGEPVTVLRNRLRELMPLDDAHEIVVGYAQDHGGYMLTAEDWLRGGYEPQITFWGPLEAEHVMEEAADLVPLVRTPEREEATAGGTNRVSVPVVDDMLTADPVPSTFGPPATLPAYILSRALPAIPPAQPAATIARLESAFVTWVGADALHGTPVVTLERETTPGTWEPVRRRSGRVVGDGDILLTHTPDPPNPMPGTMRTHYWTAEWQAVNWLDADVADPLARLADRVGAPLGRYRFHVVGPAGTGGAPIYDFTSSDFEVVAGAVSVMGSASGTTASLDLGYHAPRGFRLLDPMGGANNRFPIRGGMVSVSIDGGSATDVAVSASGAASVTVPAGFAEIVVTDRFGNTGTFRP